VNLQELINRGRFVFFGAPERLRVYDLVDGKRSTQDIAQRTKRHVNNVRRDLSKLSNVGLIQPRMKGNGELRKDGSPVFEKDPLARSIPNRYFTEPARSTPVEPAPVVRVGRKGKRSEERRLMAVPNEHEILEIARRGEDQVYEFKGPGTEARKIAREIAAMIHTRQGGIVLYGIDDEGSIIGSDVSRQKLDQSVQNSVKHSISPSVVVRLELVKVFGSDVIAIVAPPWNKTEVHQFDERVLVRKGTNVFAVSPDELRKLHRGEYIV
jgi:predicted HTH transcriptional regulator